MQFDTIAHVGAGKCGSSALQSYLTTRPELSDRSGKKLCYGALRQQRLLTPEEIAVIRNTTINGYVSSVGSVDLLRTPAPKRQQMIRSLRKFHSPLILSCEEWSTGMLEPARKNSLLELLGARGARTVKMVMFVRPPVKWVNSAWWQWGAWNRNVTFPRWLENAARPCTWIHAARNLAETHEIAEFEIRPIRGDVVSQFLDSIDCDPPDSAATVSNRSLPGEILKVYQHAPDLRPAQDVPASDFIALRALAQSDHSYGPTPWVLNPRQIQRILDATKESNQAILGMMSEQDRNAVLADPSWWTADAYSGLETVNPSALPPASPEHLIPLSADLMRLLRRAMRVVAQHGLLHELDDPLPPNWLLKDHDPAARNASQPQAAAAMGRFTTTGTDHLGPPA